MNPTGFTDVESLLIWADALLSLMLISSVWKDNIFSKIAMNIAVGAALGHIVLIASDTIYRTGITPVVSGSFIAIIGLIFGVSMFGRFTPYKWIARYPTQLVMAVGLGVAFGLTITTQIFAQVSATADNFFGPLDPLLITNAVIILVGTTTVLAYFLYTFPRSVVTQREKGSYAVIRRVARAFMMLTFGITFTGEVIFYLSVLLARLWVFWKVALGV